MIVIILWIVISALVSIAGVDKKIGYLGTLAISLFLSPLIGLIVALVSSKKVVAAWNCGNCGFVVYGRPANCSNCKTKFVYNDQKYICSSCKGEFLGQKENCPHCKIKQIY